MRFIYNYIYANLGDNITFNIKELKILRNTILIIKKKY